MWKETCLDFSRTHIVDVGVGAAVVADIYTHAHMLYRQMY